MEKNSITNFSVPKGTTHLMMWFGGALPSKKKVMYREGEYEYETSRDKEGVYVDYVKTLQQECKKMKEKGEACILVYDSEMLNDKDKEEEQLRDVVKDIPNCFLVDYEDFIKQKSDIDISKSLEHWQKGQFFYNGGPIRLSGDKTNLSHFVDHINELKQNRTNENFIGAELERKTMGNLVDCARMLLLLQPRKLKKLALEKNDKKKSDLIKTDDFTLLYHDFDMIQKKLDDKKKEEEFKNGDNSYVVFSKKMGNAQQSENINLENGLIFCYSKDDRNLEIEKFMYRYLNAQINPENYDGDDLPIYNLVNSFSNQCLINDFSNQYSDEGHRTWKKILPQKDNDIEGVNYDDAMDEETIPKQLFEEWSKNPNKDNNISFEEWADSKMKKHIYSIFKTNDHSSLLFSQSKNKDNKISYDDKTSINNNVPGNTNVPPSPSFSSQK